ncbi:MAG: prolipoprotein diacylglyceryl transferase [Syntrophobacterales bacterium]|nr:MAG: prolipoprotein diacylglyceryl transferase [Syntrophobacterales bacterium]
MLPVLFRIGPFSLHTYGVFVALGFLAGITFAVREAGKSGINREKIFDLFFYIVLAAIVGSRILYILLNLHQYRGKPIGMIKIWEGGLVFYGGFILAVGVTIWYVRRNELELWSVADILALSIALGHFFGRLGCFFAGC